MNSWKRVTNVFLVKTVATNFKQSNSLNGCAFIENPRKDPRTQNLREDPITEDSKEDLSIKNLREDPITEDKEEEPIIEYPKKNPKEDPITYNTEENHITGCPGTIKTRYSKGFRNLEV